MKKLILILILSLALTGCFYQSVNNTEIEVAITKCGSADKIVTIESLAVGSVTIHCKDGTMYSVNNGRIRQ